MNEKKREKNIETDKKTEAERKKEILERTTKIERAILTAGMIAVFISLVYLFIKFM